MIELNLIPDVKLELVKAKRFRTKIVTVSILISVVSIAAVAILASYAYGIQTVNSLLLDNSISSESKKLSSVEDLSKTLTIQNQLSLISNLNDSKKIDSRIFDVLFAVIPPAPNNVQISDLSIDSNSSIITIDGQASGGYAALEVFKKTIGGAQVKYLDNDGKQQQTVLASDISTTDVSYGEDSSGSKVLRFAISFVYATELFAPSSKSVSIVISINGNVTDSYLGVPKSIFTDRAADLKGGQ